MNKSNKEIASEVFERASALDRKAKYRRGIIASAACMIAVFALPISVALRPAGAPDPNEYNTEYCTEPSAAFYTLPESGETFIYHAAVKRPITRITVKGITYYADNDIIVTDENMGEFIEEINVDSITCAVYAYKNNGSTVILSTGMEKMAFTKE